MSPLFSQPDVGKALIKPEIVLLPETRPEMLELLKALLGLCTAGAPPGMTYRAEFLPRHVQDLDATLKEQ
jgi:hypothetical protein